MIKFVPLDANVVLKATLTGEGVGAISTATFTLYKRGESGEEVVATLDGAVVGGIATTTWKATGLAADQMSQSVNFRVVAGELRSEGGDEIVVFRNKVELTTKTEAGGNMARTLVEITIDPEPLYTPPSNAPARHTARTRVLRTGDDGKVVFDNLPPGRYTLRVRSPFSLVRWTTETGWQREAVVKRGYLAKFVWPDPAALTNSTHTQWVNLPADPAHPEHGPVLTVRAAVRTDPETGTGRAGDKIYLKVTWGGDNTGRNDTPKPEFKGHTGGKSQGPFTEFETLAADNGEVTFTINLGAAGGDRVTLAIGGTDTCEDEAISVVNWRRLFIKPVKPASLALANNRLPQTVCDVIQRHLAPAFIEPEFEVAELLPDDLGATIVTPQTAARIPKLPQGQNLVFHRKGAEKGPFNERTAQPRTPPRLHLLLGHGMLEASSESFTFTNVTSSTTPWRTSTDGDSFQPVAFDGGPIVLNVIEPEPPKTEERKRWGTDESGHPIILERTQVQIPGRRGRGSTWSDQQGNSGPIADADIEVSEDRQSFRVKLPRGTSDAPGPGRLASRSNAVTIALKLRTYSFQGGSSTGNWVSAVWLKDADELKGAMVILHELGHSVNQAAVDGDHFPGVTLAHPHTYGRGSPIDGDEHGHQGPHCAFGLSTSEKATPRYTTLVLKGKGGKCIMFGGVGPKTKYDSLTFCVHCMPYLKAANLEEL